MQHVFVAFCDRPPAATRCRCSRSLAAHRSLSRLGSLLVISLLRRTNLVHLFGQASLAR